MESPAVPYPAAFGQWHLRGGTLRCALPRKTIEVAAPASLLAAVARLCDGRLAWRDVAVELARRWDQSQVEDFLRGLCREGALVDAGEVLAHWADIGYATPPPADGADLARAARAASLRIDARAGPASSRLPAAAGRFAQLLASRASSRTFDDTPLPAGSLRAILWAAAGVTASDGAGQVLHRTIASGGNLHGLRWFAAVLRPLPDPAGNAIEPGLHEAVFHLDGGCSLQLRQAGAELAWPLLHDPRVLHFASAILLPVADNGLALRTYGNRGTVFAHIEAGQSLQNAQLMASAVGAAGVVRGDIRPAAIRRWLAPHAGSGRAPLVPMPAYVVGSRPSAGQQRQQRTDDWLALHNADTRAPRGTAASGHITCIAGPIPTPAGGLLAAGRSADARLAATKAQAEAWERRAWLTPQAGAVRACMADLPGAVDPRTLAHYSARQFARQGFPFRAFDPRSDLLWIEGHDIASGRPVRIPADHVHAAQPATPRGPRSRPLTSCTTSGVAAGIDPASALERATLEVIERHAFLHSWIAGRPLPRLDQRTLPAGARARVRSLQGARHRVAVIRLPCAWAPVMAVFVQRADPPLTAITAAADFDAEAALHKALDEAEARAGAAPDPGRPAVRHPRTPHDIHRAWQRPGLFRAADWYAGAAARERFTQPALRACADFARLQAALQAEGRTILALDITPPGAAIHQGRTPLHVVRAFIPGTLPIWFQHGLEPAGLQAYASARALRGDGLGARAAVPLHPFS